MITDHVPEQEPLPIEPLGDSSHTFKIALLFVLFAALAIGELYTLHKISSLKDSLEAQQAQTRKELNAQFQDQLSGRLTALERMNAQQLEAVKQELDAAAKRTGKTGSELKRARALVAKLQSEQQQQAEKLQEEIAQKADAQQLGALTQDVSAQRSDLDRTKKSLDSMRSDLGMTRSEFGTLIARNHDEIEQLRKMGERDYFEFTLDRNSPQRVANVGLILKKTNLKRHRFNLVVNVDDMEVEKKDRTINEPIFFYVNGSKKPYELVVNRVQSNQVKGYISTPRGATEVAARSEGTR